MTVHSAKMAASNGGKRGIARCRSAKAAAAASLACSRRIASALAGSLEKLGFERGRIEVSGERQGWQSVGAGDYWGQFLVTIEGTSVTISPYPEGRVKAVGADGAGTQVGGGPGAEAAGAPGGQADGDPVLLLRESLFRAGINPRAVGAGAKGAAPQPEPSSTAA